MIENCKQTPCKRLHEYHIINKIRCQEFVGNIFTRVWKTSGVTIIIPYKAEGILRWVRMVIYPRNRINFFDMPIETMMNPHYNNHQF